jgi:hypothetical protein
MNVRKAETRWALWGSIVVLLMALCPALKAQNADPAGRGPNFHGFDPFVNFGLASGRMDQHSLPRPYDTDLPFQTLGYMADFEGGVQYKVWRRFTLGASMWDVLPMGPQRNL